MESKKMSEEWNVFRIIEVFFVGLKVNGNDFQKKMILKFRMRIYERVNVVIWRRVFVFVNQGN